MASRPQLPERRLRGDAAARRSSARCSTRSPAASRSPAPSRRRSRCCSTCSTAIDPDARVFALDTHVLFPETYAVWREVERRYDTKVEIFEGPTLARQAELHGDALWERKPDLCCAIRKVEPLGRALGELDAWITGLRRDQSPTRAERAQGRLGRGARALEGEPARRLGRRALLGLHPRARPALQRAPRPRLRLDRLHALHAARRGPRGPLGGDDKTECGLHVPG